MISCPQNEFRHELKFMIPVDSYHRAFYWIAHSSAHFYKEFPDRQVNSIYFDSFNYDAYMDNLSGISTRKKIRYRWYGSSPSPKDGALEFKNKRNHLINKKIYKVNDTSFHRSTSWGGVRRDIMNRISRKVSHQLNEYPVPALINRYQRAYFRSRRSDIRITLDTSLVFYAQGGVSPNYTNKVDLSDMNILEIKFPPTARENVLDLMRDFQFPVTRFSKYCVGILATS